jgi:hypothetical protein
MAQRLDRLEQAGINHNRADTRHELEMLLQHPA